MNVIQERLGRLRELMAEKGMDAYLVVTADFHESEYVGEFFKCRKFLTGFTGSAGTAVVTMDEACLWTDGRYFVQAAAQLAGSGIRLMKMREEGVPTVQEYLAEKMPAGGCLGFDGRTVNAAEALALNEALEAKYVRFDGSGDLVGTIWQDRPPMSAEPVWALADCYAGENAAEKIRKLREKMAQARATVHILTSLDDIAWLLNIRGNDVLYNPVALAYVMVFEDRLLLFANEKILEGKAYPYLEQGEGFSGTVREYLQGLGVTVKPYEAVYEETGLLRGQRIMLERKMVNYAIYSRIDGSNQVIERMNPTSQAKAVKNPVEMENMRKAHIKDGVAMTRFIYWLKHNVGKVEMDEISVAEHLRELRLEQDGCLGCSFETISAYGAHAAMCHYSATEETNVKLEPKGMYLVDSGGQYYEGTTDITRTVVMGPVTDEEREHFTLVLISMLRLGADGVQMATRFIATYECDAADSFKQAVLQCTKEDIRLIKSPAGLPGRALNTRFIRRVEGQTICMNDCLRCMKPCDPSHTPYCISEALITSVSRDAQDGVVFVGANAWRIDSLLHVSQLLTQLKEEANASLKEN